MEALYKCDNAALHHNGCNCVFMVYRDAELHGSAHSPLRVREDEEGEDDRGTREGICDPSPRQSRSAVVDAGAKEQSQCKFRAFFLTQTTFEYFWIVCFITRRGIEVRRSWGVSMAT